jgi:two-component system, OmpR family, alkaline phosphatase synthesis response regulator PhoP
LPDLETWEYKGSKFFYLIMQNSCFTILLVDDEEDILEIIGYNLRNEGYKVIIAHDGKEAILKALESRPHLVILDIMMPEMDGIETCRELRKIKVLNDTIIVFFTAKSEDFIQILGLDTGADDYITKPIKPAVLMSKVNALFRRYKNEILPDCGFEIGNLRIDREKYLVFKDGKEIYFVRKEFELLSLLASKPDKVFTREEILSLVWENDVKVGERTIDVHIRKIRAKIGSDNLKTLKGVGYRFVQNPQSFQPVS